MHASNGSTRGFAGGIRLGRRRSDLSQSGLLKRLSQHQPMPWREQRRVIYNNFRDFQPTAIHRFPGPGSMATRWRSRQPIRRAKRGARPTARWRCCSSWSEGDFEDDYDAGPKPPRPIDEVPLAEQGRDADPGRRSIRLADAFHPGCEMTWPVRAATMYMAPFRFLHAPKGWIEPSQTRESLDHRSVTIPNGPLYGQLPGGITRWMAVPWQTDTGSCRSGYVPSYDPYVPSFWPARVPNEVLTRENYDIVMDKSRPMSERKKAFANREAWIEPLGADGYTQPDQQHDPAFRLSGCGRGTRGTGRSGIPGLHRSRGLRQTDHARSGALHGEAVFGRHDGAARGETRPYAAPGYSLGDRGQSVRHRPGRSFPARTAAAVIVDVAVIGAGAAGSAAAAALAPEASVALIDRVAVPEWRIGETLPGAARRVLAAIGAWERFVAAGHAEAPLKVSRWGSDTAVELDSFRDPDGVGWRLDRARFEADLRANAEARGATLIAPAAVRSLARTARGWTVALATGASLEARQIIDASGRRSRLLQPFGQRRVVADRLACAYQRLRQRGDIDPSTYIEAVPEGWWYTAALPDGWRIVSLSWRQRSARTTQHPAGEAAGGGAEDSRARGGDRRRRPGRRAGARALRRQQRGRQCRRDGLARCGRQHHRARPALIAGPVQRAGDRPGGRRTALALLGGDPAAVPRHAERMARIWRAYLGHYAIYYAMEGRWPTSPFWRRRIAPGQPLSPDTATA